MISNEVRGTLYYMGDKETGLVSTCKVSKGKYSFEHPWFWGVPSVEDILKVFSFSEEKHIQKLALIQSTAGTVMSEPESVKKEEKAVKKTYKKEPMSVVAVSNLGSDYRRWVNIQMNPSISGLRALEDKA
jgi:hypothetical protein